MVGLRSGGAFSACSEAIGGVRCLLGAGRCGGTRSFGRGCSARPGDLPKRIALPDGMCQLA